MRIFQIIFPHKALGSLSLLTLALRRQDCFVIQYYNVAMQYYQYLPKYWLVET